MVGAELLLFPVNLWGGQPVSGAGGRRTCAGRPDKGTSARNGGKAEERYTHIRDALDAASVGWVGRHDWEYWDLISRPMETYLKKGGGWLEDSRGKWNCGITCPQCVQCCLLRMGLYGADGTIT